VSHVKKELIITANYATKHKNFGDKFASGQKKFSGFPEKDPFSFKSAKQTPAGIQAG
jgi:hypothetical protein